MRASDRLGKTSLAELVDHRTDGIKRTKSGLKRHVRDLNHQIVVLEQKMGATAVSALEEVIRLKEEELARFDETRPPPVSDPASDEPLQQESIKILASIDVAARRSASLRSSIDAAEEELARLRARIEQARHVREKVEKFSSYYRSVVPEIQVSLRELQIEAPEVIVARVDASAIDRAIAGWEATARTLEDGLDPARTEGLMRQRDAAEKEIKTLQSKLDGPNRRFQKYRSDLAAWNLRRAELVGTAQSPDTLEYYRHQRDQTRGELPARLDGLRRERREAVEKLFRELTREMEVFRTYYEPALRFRAQGGEILESFDVTFDVVLDDSGLTTGFFEFVSQAPAGPFCGVAEGQKKLREMVAGDVFTTWETTIETLEQILAALDGGAREGGTPGATIDRYMRKGKKLEDFYNFLFSLDYLEPRYVLRVGGKDLHELSPGERGLLLLVFYLLIDRDSRPLIIDQPEENLDNQSVKRVLVPCIRAAKDRRQLFIVTHNPNVAVVCDAEQIIVASIDKKGGLLVRYESGSIEDGVVARRVVDVLEGTPPAFENRNRKYQTGGAL